MKCAVQTIKFSVLIAALTLSGALPAEVELEFQWDLSSTKPTIESVKWPVGVHGHEYVISEDATITLKLGKESEIRVDSERAVIVKSGQFVQSIRIFFQDMTKEEVVEEVSKLSKLFKIEGRRLDGFRVWKENSDRGIVMGNPFVFPMANLEIQKTFNLEKPWGIILRLNFGVRPTR